MSQMSLGQLTETQRSFQLATIPVGRFCTPADLAHTALFLVSPLTGFITGEVIDMNGGLPFDEPCGPRKTYFAAFGSHCIET